VDVIVDLESMGQLLRDLLTGTYTPSDPPCDQQIRTLLTELNDRTGIDFSRYKMATIQEHSHRATAGSDAPPGYHASAHGRGQLRSGER
jgi:hypothetical protein